MNELTPELLSRYVDGEVTAEEAAAVRAALEGDVDAQAAHVARFREARPGDVNLHLAVADREGEAEFLCYASGTTGRLAGADAGDGGSVLGEPVRERVKVRVRPLRVILEEHAPRDLDFGLLTVDCEGADLDVLRSNDWGRFRPRVVAVEDHEGDGPSELDAYCRGQGYELFARAYVTRIYRDRASA